MDACVCLSCVRREEGIKQRGEGKPMTGEERRNKEKSGVGKEKCRIGGRNKEMFLRQYYPNLHRFPGSALIVIEVRKGRGSEEV